MTNFMECWVGVATDLLAQALAGEPQLAESIAEPFTTGSFGFEATLVGDEKGRFGILLEGSILESSLAGEGVDQRAVWAELLGETVNAAAGELLARTGKKCRVERFEAAEVADGTPHGFLLRSGDRAWRIQVLDGTQSRAETSEGLAQNSESPTGADEREQREVPPQQPGQVLSSGLELLLDVELEASLRFGSREMPLGEILDLGPGDVVQLDRHVSDDVDLIVGDKIVARGEVVLVNGNFGLRVTEVAAPRKRLESIRCLF